MTSPALEPREAGGVVVKLSLVGGDMIAEWLKASFEANDSAGKSAEPVHNCSRLSFVSSRHVCHS